MKFPITREDLQAFDYAKEKEELREEEVQKRLAQILDQLCEQFKQGMLFNMKDKKFVWRGLYDIRQLHIPGLISRMDEYLPQFIDKVKEIFIGCDIIVDPLKTYLIIDWS